ncbi:carbohydrate kinase family protein [Veillonella agrestimuris]|uniref:carbohydrate kinase family protein n=1 Tax=Veillonella agrestimuris TaxID=2941340 RepID=UPI00203EE13E|nr:carbohydrate kinase family protein [Veillonella agrestimuris]
MKHNDEGLVTHASTHSTMNPKRQESYDIVGIGASTLDTFLVINHFPSGREVQKVLTSVRDGGGPVATALVAASKYGAKTAMIDTVGNDAAGDAIIEDFQRYGVHTQAIDVEAGASSAVATILVKEDTGERAVFFEPSTSSDVLWHERCNKLIDSAAIIHMNGRHRHVMVEAIAQGLDKGLLLSIDGGAQRYDDDLGAITKQCHIVIVARDFGEKYTSTTDLKVAVRIIHERGALIAGITDGERGSHFVGPTGTYYYCPAYKQSSVVDTTGAGDSFHGAFLAKISAYIRNYEGRPVDIMRHIDDTVLQEAAHFASAVAALNTQHMGGRSGLPTWEAVQALMNGT